MKLQNGAARNHDHCSLYTCKCVHVRAVSLCVVDLLFLVFVAHSESSMHDRFVISFSLVFTVCALRSLLLSSFFSPFSIIPSSLLFERSLCCVLCVELLLHVSGFMCCAIVAPAVAEVSEQWSVNLSMCVEIRRQEQCKRDMSERQQTINCLNEITHSFIE